MREPRLRQARTSGQAAAVELGEITAVWLARLFGLITIGAIYLLRRSRGELPARWLALLGLMGALDVAALAAILAAGNLPHPAFATGRLLGL